LKSILRDLIDKLQLNKADKQDNSLTTISKEIVPAINENKNNIDIVSANMEQKADKTDALVYEAVFNGSGDLNTANKVNKWYKIDKSAGVLNTPPTTLIPNADWAALYVQGNGLGSFIQTLYSGGYNKILKRSYFNGTYTAWQTIATTDKIDISSLPFASGVTDYTEFGQRTFYQKDSLGNVFITCWCVFSNSVKIDNIYLKTIATMPVGYRSKFIVQSICGEVFLNNSFNTTTKIPVSISITPDGRLAIGGLDYTGTNNILVFSIKYPTI